MSRKIAPNDASEHESETSPLKGEAKPGIDIEKLLQNALRIRLPVMNKEMQFVPPPRVKKVKGTNKKENDLESQAVQVQIRKQATQMYDTCKEQATNMTKDCMPGGMAIPKSPPSKVDLVAFAKKYLVDLVTNGIYVVVALILAMIPQGTVDAAAKDASPAASQRMAAVLAANAKAEAAAAQSKLLGYWVLLMGSVASIVLIVKNVRYIVNMLFELIDKIEDKINAGIDTLQKELQEDISEMLEDIMEPASDPVTSMGQKAVVKGIIAPLKKGIDDAQHALDINTLLPWVAARRLRLSVALATPCVFVVLVKLIIAMVDDSTATGRRLLVDHERRLAAASTFEHLGHMVGTLLLNALVAIISSNPSVRFISNTIIRKIEGMTNKYLLDATRASMGGKQGVENLQNTIDCLDNPSKLARMPNARSCEQCAKGCTLQ